MEWLELLLEEKAVIAAGLCAPKKHHRVMCLLCLLPSFMRERERERKRERERERPSCWSNRSLTAGGIGVPGSTASQYALGVTEFAVAALAKLT